MQTPVQVDFQGMEPDAATRASINEHIAKLESRFGRIISSRVVLKAPGHHHRTGGLYEVNIHLTLPNGKDVNVSRTRSLDERHSDLALAVNDAFKPARRQLQDHVRDLQGQVKSHKTQPVGVIAELHDDHGFLRTDDNRDIYFHRNSVLNDAFPRLRVGAHVVYAEETGHKGARASTARLLGKHCLRP
jgi:cold shock CspA family protein/ribosome-associated translation inhibitor RaiA